MPLLVISGLPMSGKTTRTKQLKEFFESKDKTVHIVCENIAIPTAGFHKNEYYSDSQKEKQVRSDLKSHAMRLLNKEDVVILDAGNYIKGYRYELFCATKNMRTTQCTLFCGITKEDAWDFNDQLTNVEPADLESIVDQSARNNSNVPYTRKMFDALCMRYEEPNGNCRWDSPLFVSFPNDTLDFDGIYGALFESKPLPPNLSTQNPPLSSTNYLYDLDRITQKIIADILSSRKIGLTGPVSIKGSNLKVHVPPNISAIQLNHMRRQFINFSKIHHSTTTTLDKVPQLFVQFINSKFPTHSSAQS